jgi:hypothetical protein
MGSTSMGSDFEELLSLFIARDVRFLVVGGYALGGHVPMRATKDIDLWVEATRENAERVWRLLAEFGVPLGAIRPDDLMQAGPWLQFGVPPNRVDILTAADGLEFGPAWERRVLRKLGRVSVPVLSLDDLIHNRRVVGRPRDLADVDVLERRRAEDAGEGRVSERSESRRRGTRPVTATRRRKAPRRRS